MKNIQNLKYLLSIVTFCFLFQNCTDVIDVDLLDTDPLVVVDAWLDNDKTIQTIRLRESNGFFDNSFAPVITGALVSVTDNNNVVFLFEEDGNTGNYNWMDTIGIGFGAIGNTYNLSININGQLYNSSSTMNRVPIIDSISYEEFDPTFGDIEEEGWEAEFFATDPIGKGDNYWIKTFKNDEFLNKPEEINLAFDAGFTGGSDIDGIPFIQPIREFINRVPDSGDDAEDTDEFPPYRSGDKIKVEFC